MKHSVARGGFGYVGLGASVVIVAILAVIVVLLVNSRTKPTDLKPGPFDELRSRALLGDVGSAEKLAALGKEACPVMLEVLQNSDNEEVKIACIQGLGANKYFDAGPAMFKILAADDDQVALRHQAYMAVTKFISDHGIIRWGSLEERREKVKEMLAEWEGKKKNTEAKMASKGKYGEA